MQFDSLVMFSSLVLCIFLPVMCACVYIFLFCFVVFAASHQKKNQYKCIASDVAVVLLIRTHILSRIWKCSMFMLCWGIVAVAQAPPRIHTQAHTFNSHDTEYDHSHSSDVTECRCKCERVSVVLVTNTSIQLQYSLGSASNKAFVALRLHTRLHFVVVVV